MAATDLFRGATPRTADPAASAIATYLTIFGLNVPAKLLTELLILVGVVALEVGSALSIVLVEATSRNVTLTAVNAVPEPEERRLRPPEAIITVVPTAVPTDEGTDKGRRLGDALLTRLKGSPGRKIKIGQRGLAKLLNCSLAETNRTIHALASAGIIAVSIDRLRGTTLSMA